jgi:threonine dehydratase
VTAVPPVRPIALDDILAARDRIAGTIVRTPLVRLELGPGHPDIRLKLENLQPINAYKLRGAANAVALLSDVDRARGVWTISAGNAGQGVAYAARQAGIRCTVVAIETAPAAKLERMRALGATLVLVPFEAAWKALEDHAFPGVEECSSPVRRADFIASHATMARNPRDAPDVAAVIAGASAAGSSPPSAAPSAPSSPKVGSSAGTETAAPLAPCRSPRSSPQVFEGWTPSFVDGAGGRSVFPRMWERMRPVIDGCIVLTLDETRRAMRLLAEKSRVIAEGAGALSVAAALTGQAGPGPVVAVVSGGNIDLAKFCELMAQ